MAKSPTQRGREHVARLRRKAHAFDKLVSSLELLSGFLPEDEAPRNLLAQVIDQAKRDVAEQKSGA